MSSVKIYFRTNQKKKNSEGYLVLSFIKNRKNSIAHLGIRLHPDYWDDVAQRVKKSHPHSKRLNIFLAKKLAEASEKLLDSEIKEETATAQSIRNSFKPAGKRISFFVQAVAYLKTLKKADSYTCFMTDLSRLGIFKEFLEGKTPQKKAWKKRDFENEAELYKPLLKGKDITFPEITPALLESFQIYLRSNRKVGERTVMNYLIVIRTIYNRAIKEGIAQQKHYPFANGKVSIKLPETTKEGFEVDEVQRLENVMLDNPTEDLARDLWLVSFYFAGMRISDVLRLRWTNVHHGRLFYTMKKNDKPGSVKIHEKALALLKKYEHLKEKPDDLIFPVLKGVDFKNTFRVKQKINFATSYYDEVLRNRVAPAAKISGPLSMHLARHSFATIAGGNVDLQELQKLYRHSHITTTANYQRKYIRKPADDALDSVLNKVKESA